MNNLLILMSTIKTKVSVFFAVVLAFLIPVKPLLLTVGLFILADTVVGIWRAKKLKQKITSRKLSNLVSKLVLYQGAVILIFVLESFILGDIVSYFVSIPLFITKLVAVTLCSIEIKSIDESFTSITGVSLWQRFKKMVSRAKEVKEDIQSLSNGNKGNENN